MKKVRGNHFTAEVFLITCVCQLNFHICDTKVVVEKFEFSLVQLLLAVEIINVKLL